MVTLGEMLVRLDGNVEKILENLVDAGFFKTKAEAIRAGILELGKEFSAIKSKEELMDELMAQKLQRIDEELASGKRKVLTEKEFLKKYPYLRDV